MHTNHLGTALSQPYTLHVKGVVVGGGGNVLLLVLSVVVLFCLLVLMLLLLMLLLLVYFLLLFFFVLFCCCCNSCFVDAVHRLNVQELLKLYVSKLPCSKIQRFQNTTVTFNHFNLDGLIHNVLIIENKKSFKRSKIKSLKDKSAFCLEIQGFNEITE